MLSIEIIFDQGLYFTNIIGSTLNKVAKNKYAKIHLHAQLNKLLLLITTVGNNLEDKIII